MRRKSIFTVTALVGAVALMLVSCGVPPTVVSTDSASLLSPTEPPAITPMPMLESYSQVYFSAAFVKLELPWQGMNVYVYSKPDYIYESVKITGGFSFLQPVLYMYATDTVDGDENVYMFDPSMTLTVEFTSDFWAGIKMDDKNKDNLVILIFDDTEGVKQWVACDGLSNTDFVQCGNTTVVQNADGSGYGVVDVMKWTSGVAWGCRGGCSYTPAP